MKTAIKRDAPEPGMVSKLQCAGGQADCHDPGPLDELSGFYNYSTSRRTFENKAFKEIPLESHSGQLTSLKKELLKKWPKEPVALNVV